MSGFTKAFKRERSEALVKVVDFEAETDPERLAELLVAETLSDPGAVEIGHHRGARYTVTVRETPLTVRGPTVELGPESVFVVTGAAGSIVSAIIADLTKAAGGGTFYLLDLAAEPDADDEDIAWFRKDREELKRRLIRGFEERGERVSPVKVEREIATLERKSGALAAIETIVREGGTVHYHAVDLLDGEAVAGVIELLRHNHGRVDVLLHAAGIEISHMLPDKKPEEFDLVLDVKCDGWFNLLAAIGDLPLGATVAFSSVAGRFGNAGQTDYSAANDLLCKLTSNLRRRKPETCAIVIDWTAWSSIGMAARGSIPRMMKIAGIDMLAPNAGIPIIRRELTGAGSGELVIGQRLGILLEEWDDSGGLDLTTLDTRSVGPMVAEVVGMTVHGGLCVETELDPGKQPFLYDHKIDDMPVLPGVMGIEAFGELARLLYPDRHVLAFEQVRFSSPFKFYRGEPRRVFLRAQFRIDGDDVVADCQLIGRRKLPTHPEPLETVHFTASVRLGSESAPVSEASPVPEPEGESADRDAIYRVYFHGSAYQVLERVWAANGSLIGRLPRDLPANHLPAELPTVIEPRLIELCLQTAGVWEIGRKGKLALPRGIERLTTAAGHTPKGAVHAVVTPNAAGDSFDAYVADESGVVLLSISGYQTATLPDGIDDDRRMPLAKVVR